MRIGFLDRIIAWITRFNAKMACLQCDMMVNQMETGSPFIKAKQKKITEYQFDPFLVQLWSSFQNKKLTMPNTNGKYPKTPT